eukprot:1137066-Pelagomonas_calceolata.AAC.9
MFYFRGNGHWCVAGMGTKLVRLWVLAVLVVISSLAAHQLMCTCIAQVYNPAASSPGVRLQPIVTQRGCCRLPGRAP